MTAEQAKEFGLIDKVIKSRDDAEGMLDAAEARAGVTASGWARCPSNLYRLPRTGPSARHKPVRMWVAAGPESWR